MLDLLFVSGIALLLLMISDIFIEYYREYKHDKEFLSDVEFPHNFLP